MQYACSLFYYYYYYYYYWKLIRISIRKYSVCTNVQLCTAPLLQCEPRFLYYLFKSGTISYFFARSSGALSHSVKSVSVEGHIFPPNLVSIRSVFSHATQSASSDTFLFPPNKPAFVLGIRALYKAPYPEHYTSIAT